MTTTSVGANFLRVCFVILLGFGVMGGKSMAADKKVYPTLGKIERKDPRFDKLVPKEAKIEVLASGFTW